MQPPKPKKRPRVFELVRFPGVQLNWEERPGLLGWLTTCDHKRIGILYLFTSLAFFAAGGVEALLVRTQLIRPDNGLDEPQRVVPPAGIDAVMPLAEILEPRTDADHGANNPARPEPLSRTPTVSSTCGHRVTWSLIPCSSSSSSCRPAAGTS